MKIDTMPGLTLCAIAWKYVYKNLIMINQHEFYFNKEKTRKKLFKDVLIFLAILTFLVIVFISLKTQVFTEIMLSFAPLIFLYIALKTLKEYKYTEPVIAINAENLILKRMDFFLNFIEQEIKINEIKTIGTDIKMKGEKEISKSLSIKMLNTEKFTFPMDVFDFTHVDIYHKIKELNLEAKLFNIGDFAYE